MNNDKTSPVAPEQVVAAGWIDAKQPPDVRIGSERSFIVAVKRRHNGKTYVFSATYLNAKRVLMPESETAEIHEDGTPITGWYDEVDDPSGEFDTIYRQVLSDGDVLTHYRPFPASPEAASAVMLTDTEMARIHRRVTGASRFDESAIMLMREVEHAMNEKRAATPAAPSADDESADAVANHEHNLSFQAFQTSSPRPPMTRIAGVSPGVLERAAKRAALAQPAPVQNSIDAALDFEPDAQHTVADMANIGYALMQALPEGYTYNDSPTEIVADLQNEIADLKAAPVQQPESERVEMLVAALELFVGGDPLHSLCRHEGMDALGRVKGTWSAAAEANARSALKIIATTAPGQQMIDWVAERWNAEVKNRPMVNIHRRSLDDTWRQVLRYLGVDDRARLGPTHDELAAPTQAGAGDAKGGDRG